MLVQHLNTAGSRYATQAPIAPRIGSRAKGIASSRNDALVSTIATSTVGIELRSPCPGRVLTPRRRVRARVASGALLVSPPDLPVLPRSCRQTRAC